MQRPGVAAAAAVVLLVAGCGSGDGSSAAAERPTIVVTTSFLGDVVENIVGSDAEVVTIMPRGASPHDFQASAQQVNQMREADAMIVNGAGFEAGLVDVIEGAEADGVPTFVAIAAVSALDGVSSRGDDDQDDHDDVDPHFFTDPARMADAVDGIAEFLVDVVPSIDAGSLGDRANRYRSVLDALDLEIESILADVDEERRVMVTNHEVFEYFADRYGFEVIGTVIPSGSTGDGVSAGALAALASLIEEKSVPAIFADTSSPARLAETLADEVGDIEVVELFSESLGADGSGGETYVDMLRTNAQRIASALE